MNPSDYTPDQRKDIEERVAKAKQFLEDNSLYPASVMQYVNTGSDIFATKVFTYLQDSKYKSPIQTKDIDTK